MPSDIQRTTPNGCYHVLQVHDCIVTTKDISNPGAPGQFVGGGIVNLEAAFNCVRSAQQQQ